MSVGCRQILGINDRPAGDTRDDTASPSDVGPDAALSAIAQRAYVKASNTGPSDEFGDAVALSADGSLLVVGAPAESSAAIGINGNQADNSASSAGAVYVFTRSGTTWIQQAYLKASNAEAGDQFGMRVALSADGSTLAVSAAYEDSAGAGSPADNSKPDAGAVYVFVRNSGTWTQQAYLKASNADPGDLFGYALSTSADGSTLAVGAFRESSSDTRINGVEADNSAPDAGAVYVFTRVGLTWTKQAYIKASNAGTGDDFGWSVSLSADGALLAVGVRDDSDATGIDGDAANNNATMAGAVFVYERSGTSWAQQAYIKASNTAANDEFSYSISLSGDGSTLAVGAHMRDDTGANAGAVYIFTRTTSWSQQVYIRASNSEAYDLFGRGVQLSGDGSTLAVAAPEEDGATIGIGGDEADNSAPSAGAVYAFTRVGATWSQRSYVKASNTGRVDYFGTGLAVSADASTLVVGAPGEDSAAINIDGNQLDESAPVAGAAYVFQ